jgi:hypothetical protein
MMRMQKAKMEIATFAGSFGGQHPTASPHLVPVEAIAPLHSTVRRANVGVLGTVPLILTVAILAMPSSRRQKPDP